MFTDFRWWLTKQLNKVVWWILPEPHKSIFTAMWKTSFSEYIHKLTPPPDDEVKNG